MLTRCFSIALLCSDCSFFGTILPFFLSVLEIRLADLQVRFIVLASSLSCLTPFFRWPCICLPSNGKLSWDHNLTSLLYWWLSCLKVQTFSCCCVFTFLSLIMFNECKDVPVCFNEIFSIHFGAFVCFRHHCTGISSFVRHSFFQRPY